MIDSVEARNDVHSVVDLEGLAEWMDTQALGSGAITHARSLVGGTQNILVKFRREARDYVLRRPPEYPRAGNNETMRREARILSALRGTEVPHPRLIAACGDETVLGAAFYLMEPVDGFNPTTSLPPPYFEEPSLRHAMGLAAVDGAAALAAVDYLSVGLGDLGKSEDFLQRQVNRWRTQLESYGKYAGWPGPRNLPNVERTAGWLEVNRPSGSEPGILHGDYHLANVMFRFDEPRLAAIVDWELATIGDPLLDLGWLLATWPDPDGKGGAVAVTPWQGFPRRAELIQRYRERSGRNLDAIEWYAVLACYKLGILLEGTYARSRAGKAPAETGERLHGLARSLLRRADVWSSQAAFH